MKGVKLQILEKSQTTEEQPGCGWGDGTWRRRGTLAAGMAGSPACPRVKFVWILKMIKSFKK